MIPALIAFFIWLVVALGLTVWTSTGNHGTNEPEWPMIVLWPLIIAAMGPILLAAAPFKFAQWIGNRIGAWRSDRGGNHVR